MSIVPVPVAYELESFVGKTSAPHEHVFAAWGATLDPASAQLLASASAYIKETTARATVGQLLKMTWAQFETNILVEHCKLDEVKAGAWRESFEDIVDMKFTDPSAPMPVSNQLAVRPNPIADAASLTISADLAKTGELYDYIIPPVPASHLETANPKVVCVTENDIKAGLDWAIEYLYSKFGRINVGARLAKQIGRQLDSYMPIKPNRKRVLGSTRHFEKMLVGRIYNMTSSKGPVRLNAPSY